MIKNKKIYVVMPAHNESMHISGVIKKLPPFVDKIIVVDDNSSDNTAEVALATDDQRVSVITNSQNLGVGGAMIAGYRRALQEQADVVVKIDSDGQMDPSFIKKLIKPVVNAECDYAKGFRFHDRKTLEKMPRLRLFGNMGLSYLVKMASGYWDIFDPTSGFTAIHRTALELINLDSVAKDYYFETNMLCKLYHIQAKIKDVLIPCSYGDETSELNPIGVLLKFPGKLFRSYLKRILWRYYIRDFSTFSLLFFFGWVLFLFGFSFGVVEWILNATKGIVTSTGTVMLSVVPLFLGFQMILQAMLLDINNVPKESLQKTAEDNDD